MLGYFPRNNENVFYPPGKHDVVLALPESQYLTLQRLIDDYGWLVDLISGPVLYVEYPSRRKECRPR